MPDPSVVIAMREFKMGLLVREDKQMREMARHWLQIEDALDVQIVLLSDEFAQRRESGETLSGAVLYRLERTKRLRAQIRDEFEGYVQYADEILTHYQEESGALGIDHAAQAIRFAYLDGGQVGTYFDRLPVEAVQNVVGIAGDGKPLGDLLRRRMIRDEDGTELAGVWDRLTQTLIDGTALGQNPRKVARMMRDDLAGGLNKALVIGRTEGLRPYREMSRAQYEHSGVIEGQRRLATHDARVCGACLADEGTLYGIHAIISDHPQGRCTGVPVVRGMPEVQWMAGEQWFRQQPEPVQRSILGEGRYEAWRERRFAFHDLVTHTHDSVWGDGIVPTPLNQLAA
jgi:hypothetical protein